MSMISEEAVNHIKVMIESLEFAIKAIESNKEWEGIIPNVQPKMGHWEWNQYDANPKIGNFHCSLCHIIGRTYYDYCPGCGAKMSEIPTGAEGSEE